MCQMCEIEREHFGEILPGWYLCRATKDDDGSGAYHVKAGWWLLVRENSGQASIIWTDEEEKQCIKDFNDQHTYADDLFWCAADVGYLLTQSAVKEGFKVGEENFNNWFLRRLISFRKG